MGITPVTWQQVLGQFYGQAGRASVKDYSGPGYVSVADQLYVFGTEAQRDEVIGVVGGYLASVPDIGVTVTAETQGLEILTFCKLTSQSGFPLPDYIPHEWSYSAFARYYVGSADTLGEFWTGLNHMYLDVVAIGMTSNVVYGDLTTLAAVPELTGYLAEINGHMVGLGADFDAIMGVLGEMAEIDSDEDKMYKLCRKAMEIINNGSFYADAEDKTGLDKFSMESRVDKILEYTAKMRSELIVLQSDPTRKYAIDFGAATTAIAGIEDICDIFKNAEGGNPDPDYTSDYTGKTYTWHDSDSGFEDGVFDALKQAFKEDGEIWDSNDLGSEDRGDVEGTVNFSRGFLLEMRKITSYSINDTTSSTNINLPWHGGGTIPEYVGQETPTKDADGNSIDEDDRITWWNFNPMREVVAKNLLMSIDNMKRSLAMVVSARWEARNIVMQEMRGYSSYEGFDIHGVLQREIKMHWIDVRVGEIKLWISTMNRDVYVQEQLEAWEEAQDAGGFWTWVAAIAAAIIAVVITIFTYGAGASVGQAIFVYSVTAISTAISAGTSVGQAVENYVYAREMATIEESQAQAVEKQRELMEAALAILRRLKGKGKDPTSQLNAAEIEEMMSLANVSTTTDDNGYETLDLEAIASARQRMVELQNLRRAFLKIKASIMEARSIVHQEMTGISGARPHVGAVTAASEAAMNLHLGMFDAVAQALITAVNERNEATAAKKAEESAYKGLIGAIVGAVIGAVTAGLTAGIPFGAGSVGGALISGILQGVVTLITAHAQYDTESKRTAQTFDYSKTRWGQRDAEEDRLEALEYGEQYLNMTPEELAMEAELLGMTPEGLVREEARLVEALAKAPAAEAAAIAKRLERLRQIKAMDPAEVAKRGRTVRQIRAVQGSGYMTVAEINQREIELMNKLTFGNYVIAAGGGSVALNETEVANLRLEFVKLQNLKHAIVSVLRARFSARNLVHMEMTGVGGTKVPGKGLHKVMQAESDMNVLAFDMRVQALRDQVKAENEQNRREKALKRGMWAGFMQIGSAIINAVGGGIGGVTSYVTSALSIGLNYLGQVGAQIFGESDLNTEYDYDSVGSMRGLDSDIMKTFENVSMNNMVTGKNRFNTQNYIKYRTELTNKLNMRGALLEVHRARSAGRNIVHMEMTNIGGREFGELSKQVHKAISSAILAAFDMRAQQMRDVAEAKTRHAAAEEEVKNAGISALIQTGLLIIQISMREIKGLEKISKFFSKNAGGRMVWAFLEAIGRSGVDFFTAMKEWNAQEYGKLREFGEIRRKLVREILEGKEPDRKANEEKVDLAAALQKLNDEEYAALNILALEGGQNLLEGIGGGYWGLNNRYVSQLQNRLERIYRVKEALAKMLASRREARNMVHAMLTGKMGDVPSDMYQAIQLERDNSMAVFNSLVQQVRAYAQRHNELEEKRKTLWRIGAQTTFDIVGAGVAPAFGDKGREDMPFLSTAAAPFQKMITAIGTLFGQFMADQTENDRKQAGRFERSNMDMVYTEQNMMQQEIREAEARISDNEIYFQSIQLERSKHWRYMEIISRVIVATIQFIEAQIADNYAKALIDEVELTEQTEEERISTALDKFPETIKTLEKESTEKKEKAVAAMEQFLGMYGIDSKEIPKLLKNDADALAKVKIAIKKGPEDNRSEAGKVKIYGQALAFVSDPDLTNLDYHLYTELKARTQKNKAKLSTMLKIQKKIMAGTASQKDIDDITKLKKEVEAETGPLKDALKKLGGDPFRIEALKEYSTRMKGDRPSSQGWMAKRGELMNDLQTSLDKVKDLQTTAGIEQPKVETEAEEGEEKAPIVDEDTDGGQPLKREKIARIRISEGGNHEFARVTTGKVGHTA